MKPIYDVFVNINWVYREQQEQVFHDEALIGAIEEDAQPRSVV